MQSTSTKCNNGHELQPFSGVGRNNPTCNRCGAKSLQSCHSCFNCNFDICQNCYSGKGSFQQQQNFGSQSSTKCINNHELKEFTGVGRNYPTCKKCGALKLQHCHSCFECNYDICVNCFKGQSNFNQQNQFSNQNQFNSQNFNNQNQFNSQNLNNQNQFNNNQGFNNNQMQYSTQAFQYKKCPNNHHLTLCDSNLRYHPSCNGCGRQNLNNSWSCFPCDYDMCLTCYDQNNTHPTKNCKVCLKGHVLVYTTKYQRQNVTCDRCGRSYLDSQFTCYGCNFDLCMNCYQNHQNHYDFSKLYY